jgi:hypothetical protein
LGACSCLLAAPLLLAGPSGDCTFVRGNIINRSEDAEPVVDLNDGVEVIAFLLLGNDGSIPDCIDAADVNDNGLVDLSDYVYLVNARFNGGPAIPAPFPTAGTDTTPGVTVPSARDPRFRFAIASGAGVPNNTGISLPVTLTNQVPIRGLTMLFQYSPASIRIDEIITEEGTLLSAESAEYIKASFDNNRGVAFIAALKDFATPFAFQTGGNPDIPAGENQLVATLKCGIVISADQGFAAIDFVDGLKATAPTDPDRRPEIHNLITLDGTAVRPELGTGAGIDIRRGFIRGDSNKDSGVDIGDPIFLLNYIFMGARRPPCLDAADANNDTRLDISDSIWMLNFLFMGGPEPSEPYPQPGVDPSDDGGGSLGCASDE